tara:strand:- start:1956 stop:3185 length:1230 start_codon:yes stop_codon:yes gene_type:complete
MEGILIWIVIIVGWAIIKGVFSSGGSGKYQDEQGEDIDALQISVKHEVPDKAYQKERDLNINFKCFIVRASGLVGTTYHSRVKIILNCYDNTDKNDDEIGLSVVSAHEAYSENSQYKRIFGREYVMDVSPSTYYPKGSVLFLIPAEFIVPPHSGKRKLKFTINVCDEDTQVAFGGYDDTSKIIYHASDIVDFNYKDIGYMDAVINKDKVEDLTIKLAMCMAAADGHLDQKELNVIKDWAKNLANLLEDDKKSDRKKHFTKFIKDTYTQAKAKRISISDIVKEFNKIASKTQKYEAIELLLNISSADGKLSKEEEVFINKIAKTTNIDLKTFRDMKNKVVASVEKIETLEKPSETTFGLSDDMTEKEKCRSLTKQYNKWKGQTTHKDSKRKKRAKEMIKAIADLRKQYNC